MREALEAGASVVAVTMDIRQFYHRVCPDFATRDAYLATVHVSLTPNERAFTQSLLQAIATWYESTPDAVARPTPALPVGLSASKVLSNALLADFDRKLVAALHPEYFGRYVDDIFLVLRSDVDFASGRAVMTMIAERVPELLSFSEDDKDGECLRLRLPYANDSDLVFAGSKQKIFCLNGAHGLDLIVHINEQIRRQSSEHRLLPLLPDTGEEMASRALLAQPSNSLEADALRKADVISVRRLGLALLIRDIEAYARDLPPRRWKAKREEFYGLVQRHVITPLGLFEFFPYVHRVFALMVACSDFEPARQLLTRLVRVIGVVEATTTAGTEDRAKYQKCREYFARALVQAAVQATTVARFRWSAAVLAVWRQLQDVSADVAIPSSAERARRASKELLYADLGRRAYREFWLTGAASTIKSPPVPTNLGVRRLMRLGAIRAFRVEAGLPAPHWPAVVCPTRPLGLAELTRAAPALLHRPVRLRAALFAFRGARARRDAGFGLLDASVEGGAPELVIRTTLEGNPRIAIPSFRTDDRDWSDAALGRPRLTVERYERLRRMLNAMCRTVSKPTHIAFPECSVPWQWASGLAHRLAQQKISFLAGMEYRVTPKGLRNDAIVSLTTDWPWYPACVTYVQPKMAPAHEERRKLRKLAT